MKLPRLDNIWMTSLLFILTGCGGGSTHDDPVEPGILSVYPSPLKDFGHQGGKVDLEVTSNCMWTTKIDPEPTTWISLSQVSGLEGTSKVRIEVKPNTEPVDREGEIVFKARAFSTTLRIRQAECPWPNGGIDDMPVEKL